MSRTDQAARGRAIEAYRDQSRFALAKVAAATGLLGAVAGAALAWTTVAPNDRQLAIDYTRTQAEQAIRDAFIPGDQVQYQPAGEEIAIVEAPGHVAMILLVRRLGIAGGCFAILFAVGLTTLQRRYWISVAEKAALDEVRRGARSATPEQLNAMLAPTGKRATGGLPITIGAVALPAGIENRHLLAVGATGTGKTSFLFGLVEQIAIRGESAVLYDPDGTYISRFYQPVRGDLILNCWDQRTVRWSLIDDIRSLADAHRVAAVLLPKPANAGESSFWWDEARLLLAHILHHLASIGGSLDDLADLLNGGTDEEVSEDHIERLRAIVRGTPAATIFTAGGDKATASVVFMTGIAARTVHTLAAISRDAEPFSFDRFVATLDDRDGPKPFVFLACPRRNRDLGTPIVAAWLDAVASAILQRTPDRGTNIWAVIDELASLPPVQSLSNLMPEGRKYRACVTIAFQSLAQLNAAYGEPAAHVITGQTSTQLFMRLGDSLTADWAIKLIGQAEVEGLRPTINLDTQAKGDRGSLAHDRHRETLLMDADLTMLPTGAAFLRLAGYPVARIHLLPPSGESGDIAPALIEAPDAAVKIASTHVVRAQPRVEHGDDWLPEVGDS